MRKIIRLFATALGVKFFYHVVCEYYDRNGRIYHKSTNTAFATPWLHEGNLDRLKKQLSGVDGKDLAGQLIVSITKLGI